MGLPPLLMFWSHVNQYLSHNVKCLGDNMKPGDGTVDPSPPSTPGHQDRDTCLWISVLGTWWRFSRCEWKRLLRMSFTPSTDSMM